MQSYKIMDFNLMLVKLKDMTKLEKFLRENNAYDAFVENADKSIEVFKTKKSLLLYLASCEE